MQIGDRGTTRRTPAAGRLAAGLIAVGLLGPTACARDNPLFGGGDGPGTTTQGGEPTGTTARTSTTDDSTTKAAASDTAGTNDIDDSTGKLRHDLGDSTGPKTTEPEVGSEVGSDSDGSSGKTLPGSVVVFATTRTNGVFAEKGVSAWDGAVAHCDSTRDELGRECDTLWPFLAIDGIPLADLPSRPGGEALEDATITGPDETIIAASFAALADGDVYLALQPAVTAHLDASPSTQTWAGDPDLDGGPSAGTCANWAIDEATGHTRTYSNAASFPLEATRACGQTYSILCLCF